MDSAAGGRVSIVRSRLIRRTEMRRKVWLLRTVATIALATAALAQEPPTGAPETTPEMKARSEATQRAPASGEPHKVLEYMIGDWTTACKMRWPEKEPWMDCKGTASSKWILDGH